MLTQGTTLHLILGRNNAILIDAQFTLSDAKKVVAAIKNSGKKLQSIYITHGHPDHYFGLEAIQSEFPGVPVVTSPEVLADMKATADGKFAYWKPLVKEDLTSKVVFPTASEAKFLELDGQRIEIESVTGAEAHEQNILKIPSANVIIAGDLVYSKVHLWLAEGRAAEWKSALLKIERETPKNTRVLPGHGPSGGVELFKLNRDYIDAFQQSLKLKTAQEAKDSMKARFADFGLPVIVDIAVDAAFAVR